MGITESSLQTCVKPLQTCVSEVLGSFDCTMKSKCCENYKCTQAHVDFEFNAEEIRRLQHEHIDQHDRHRKHHKSTVGHRLHSDGK